MSRKLQNTAHLLSRISKSKSNLLQAREYLAQFATQHQSIL